MQLYVRNSVLKAGSQALRHNKCFRGGVTFTQILRTHHNLLTYQEMRNVRLDCRPSNPGNYLGFTERQISMQKFSNKQKVSKQKGVIMTMKLKCTLGTRTLFYHLSEDKGMLWIGVVQGVFSSF